MASNDLTDLKAKLQQLRKATKIVLMMVPYRTSFRARIDEVELPEVSCVYEITSGRGQSFNEVLDIIGNAVIKYEDGPKPDVDLRVGIVFKGESKILQEFYFDDSGGDHEVNGFSGGRRISASANLPNELRALLTRQDVILVRNRHSRCPHS
jgi:hypothetical protein